MTAASSESERCAEGAHAHVAGDSNPPTVLAHEAPARRAAPALDSKSALMYDAGGEGVEGLLQGKQATTGQATTPRVLRHRAADASSVLAVTTPSSSTFTTDRKAQVDVVAELVFASSDEVSDAGSPVGVADRSPRSPQVQSEVETALLAARSLELRGAKPRERAPS